MQHNKMSFLLQVLVTLFSIAAITAQQRSTRMGTTKMAKLQSIITCETENKGPGMCVPADRCWIENRTVSPQDLNVCFIRREAIYICCPEKMEENEGRVGVKPKPSNPPEPQKGNSTDRAPSTTSMRTEINLPGCGKMKRNLGGPSQIIDGAREAEKGSWPWMASIGVRTYEGNFRHICSGSLITQRHTLTAAQCVIRKGLIRSPSDFRVVFGSHYRERQSDSSLEEGIVIVTPVELRIHEKNQYNYHDNDLAIMVLDAAVPISDFISTICLPTAPKYKYVKGSVTVTGWGRTSYEGLWSKTLQEVRLRVIPTRQCRYLFRKFHGNKITDNMLCAGELKEGTDSCAYDAGGPLVKYDAEENKWFEVGIASFGYQCGTRGFPGVYVRVSRFVPWIQQVVEDTSRYLINTKIPA